MKDNKSRYHDFCQTEKLLPIFFQDWYLDSVCGYDNWEVMIIEKSGEIAAVHPYYLKSKLGFKYITMPPLTKFMGPYIIDKYKNKTQSIYKEFIQTQPKVDHFIQNFYYQVKDWLPYYWTDFKQQTLYSYIINNFRDDKIYFNSIDRYYKKKIKQAQNIITIESKETNNDISQSFNLIKKTFDRQKSNVPFTLKIYTNLIENIISHNQGKIFIAKNNDKTIIAAAILIWDNNSAYYLISGDDPRFRSSAPGIYLIYKMVRYTADKLQLDSFDFLGSMIPSLEIIRRKFSAKAHPYFEIQKTTSKVFTTLSKLKNI